MELKRKPRGFKVYRGAYKYLKGDTIYCEEEFEVYKDSSDLSLCFFAQLHSRVSTGELLSIYVDFLISKDFVPQKVLVEKSLGSDTVTEIYDFNPRKNIVDYIFVNKKGEQKHTQVTTSPRFSIHTPATCTSMIFLKGKKEDTTTKNYYNVLVTQNAWTYKDDPVNKTVVLERTGLSTENINVEGKNLQATGYHLYDVDDLKHAKEINKSTVPSVKVSLSKHATIPYMVKAPNGTKIQVKYLNDLDRDS